MTRRRLHAGWILGICAAALLWPQSAWAYVGPGAGIAIATTALAFVVSLVLALVGLLLWPLRFVYRLITRKRPPNPARVKRAVLVGLDGLDPDLCERFMAAGRMPNLTRLAQKGGFSKLATTFPAMSPVAWSSFATGVNPAKHGIYDFLQRDLKTYLPDLSSAEVKGPHRHLDVGKWRIPLGAPQVRLLRKSQPFWKILGRYQVPCSILRVPITFPPEAFEGTLLSAMCVPDLEGSQGTFSYYTEGEDLGEAIGGKRFAVKVENDTVQAALTGPPNPLRSDEQRVRLPFSVRLDRAGGKATLRIGGRKVELRPGAFSDWIPVAFPLVGGAGFLGPKLRGMCRFRLLELQPRFRLYVTPINIDPENPVLPISHPRFFATFLAKLFGRYATLGLAEDTWALNEKVLDEDAFLEQAWANHAEREAQFFEMLKRTPRGLITCVFDGSDRIQHMFMRFLDQGHPAAAEGPADPGRSYEKVIEDTYARLDEMLGRVMQEVDPEDPRNQVAVISDHGFKTFRRGVNLNSWLLQQGYLALKPGCTESREWFRDVDWTRTRAFALGLGGVFLNIQGREAHGVVSPHEARGLAEEIAAKLSGLIDSGAATDTAPTPVAIRQAYPAHAIYKGPYAEDAPDLIIGYAAGWRASWDGVRGVVNDVVFDDNTKAWSGDHCIDPDLVPGVLVTNQKAWAAVDRAPAISDLAPTLLALFGVPAPRYMDGRSLLPSA